MSYATWDPFRELNTLRREIDRIFDGHGLERWSFPFSRFSFLPGRSARAYPLLNVSEDAENYYVEALAPGLDTGNLKVSVVGEQLSIEGEKENQGREASPEAWHRSERSAGRFIRTVNLPGEAQIDKVSAVYHNGLLQITLPKAEAIKPKQIAVNVA